MALVPRVVVTMAVALVLIPAGAASAAPLIESTLLKGGAVSGRTIELQVSASDRLAPVTGMVVGFGAGEAGYGLSNCLPPDYRGRSFGPIAAPGRRVTLVAPHIYRRTGRRLAVTNVTSGGCTLGQASTLQTVLVDVVRQGQTPPPIVTSPQVSVPVGQLVPALPGLGQLPSSPVNLNIPGGTLPGGVTIPGVTVPVPTPPVQIPQIPPVQIPPVPGLPDLGLPKATGAAGCPNRNRWFARTRRGERRAKAALLCLLNKERRRRGLRAMRANGKLARAAKAHSRSMVRGRFFAHVGLNRSTPTSRLYRARYLPGRGRWAVGENIGFGTGAMTRPAAIHRAWMNSTPHRAAMLSRRFREVGFGIYPGIPFQRRGATFTADFATTR